MEQLEHALRSYPRLNPCRRGWKAGSAPHRASRSPLLPCVTGRQQAAGSSVWRAEQLDRELAGLARADAALRLRLGQPFEVLSQKAHCFTLGFSSVTRGSAERRVWHSMLASLYGWLESGAHSFQMSGARSRASASAGRVELRLRVPRHLFHWWRGLQAQALRWLPRGLSWLRFLCLSVWRGWGTCEIGPLGRPCVVVYGRERQAA